MFRVLFLTGSLVSAIQNQKYYPTFMDNQHKILVIDDDLSLRKSLLAYFEDCDYLLCEAGNGKEGIDEFIKEEPDIVLTDLKMPVMDGLGVLEWFKNNRPLVPVIVVSGAGDISLVVEALRLGAWDYILKPIADLTLLSHAVINAIEKADLQKENLKYRENLEGIVKVRTEELKTAQEIIIQSEKNYRILAENVADIIWLRNMNLELVYVSPSVTLLTGFSIEQYKNLCAVDKLAPGSMKILKEFIREEELITRENQLQLNKTMKYEIELIRSDGRKIWMENNVKFIRDAKGRAINLLGVSRDVTERKKYENDLKIARDFAEENDRLKTAFLNNMSHEIRTPLNVIQGYVGLLAEDLSEKHEMKHFTEPILRSSEQLIKIIDDILNISIIETGQIIVSNQKFNLNNLISETLAELKIGAIRKDLGLIYDHTLPLDDSEIISDPFKVKQIIINLVSNGIKFTRKGEVEVRAEKNSKEVILSVRDTGPGIEKKYFEKIFERFQRVELMVDNEYHSVTHGGTGLGLSISKGLVKVLGGKIWLESEVGKGSTFYFSLPI